jgi:hypothetical protein
MSDALQRFATDEPAVCAVCRRRAVWLGYAPFQGTQIAEDEPLVWLCDDPHCHRAARSAYTMPPPTLDAFEKLAAIEAGQLGGAYLEEIGITDLAKLSETQWREFVRRILVGFEQALRRKIVNGESPF